MPLLSIHSKVIFTAFTYGAGLHIWYSFQKKSQRFKIVCLEELGYKDGWITKEKLMKIVVSLGNTHYGNYVKMIAEQYSGNG